MQFFQNIIEWLLEKENYKWFFDGAGFVIGTIILSSLVWIYRKFFMKIRLFKKKDKTNTNILFIDNKHFPIVDILRGPGYGYKARRIKDVDGPDDSNLKDVDIFFVDILGVGKKMNADRQGFGIVECLNKTFPRSKIVIYSEEKVPSDPAYGMADAIMEKDSEGYEFSRVIDGLIEKL